MHDVTSTPTASSLLFTMASKLLCLLALALVATTALAEVEPEPEVAEFRYLKADDAAA